MTDTTPGVRAGARPHSTGTTAGAQPGIARAPTLSVVEAARVAGVNDRTIRRVIADGKLVATVEQGAYRVAPDALAAWTATRAPRATPDVSPDVAPGDARPAVAGADVLAAKDELVAALTADVVFLRDQLDQARRDLAEAHRTAVVARELDAQRIEARLEALTAQIVEQREDAEILAHDAPGSTEGASEDPSSWWERTWRKMRGA